MHRLAAFLFLSFSLVAAQGQSLQQNALRFHYGAIWAHNPPVDHLAQSHVHGASFTHFITPDTTKKWQLLYNYPLYGYTMLWLNYNSPAVLGQSFSAIAFIQPVLFKSGHWTLAYHLGTGLVYHTKVFDKQVNPTNIMISSRVSMAMQGGLHLRQRVSKSWSFTQSIELTHFSNGAFRMPNSGINNFTASVGLSGNMPLKPKAPVQDEKLSLKRWQWSAHGSAGLIERFPTGGKKYAIWHAQLSTTYRVGQKSGLTLGGEGIWNRAIRQEIIQNNLDVPFVRAGIVAGHELYVSRVSLLTQLGVYAFNKTTIDPPIYQRYGLKYYFNPNLYGALFLKTHYARAECIEWGLGIQW
jgi:hypothetical protein